LSGLDRIALVERHGDSGGNKQQGDQQKQVVNNGHQPAHESGIVECQFGILSHISALLDVSLSL